jgi:alkanesulfonate monooxygenase SsuD/methylene tetrahydromethanopterin reductase-like flavin-dependent oxidoreductase (luciferase family)
MDLFANLTAPDPDPRGWAQAREAEGYEGVSCSDHYVLSSAARGVRPFPHLWVSLAAMACGTSQVRMMSAFANNLFRSPVEFAQASLAVQSVSNGRFEAGLGAAWTKDELVRTGQEYPEGRVRARMLVEALQIARSLLTTGGATFDGEHYQVDLPPGAIGPAPPHGPPPLVASVGSPWTMRHVPPLVDRVELKIGRSTREGALDVGVLGTVTVDEVRAMVDTVRSVAPDVPISAFVLTAAGDGPEVEAMRTTLGDNLLGSVCGEPKRVLDHLLALEDLGLDALLLTEWTPGTYTALAEARRAT